MKKIPGALLGPAQKDGKKKKDLKTLEQVKQAAEAKAKAFAKWRKAVRALLDIKRKARKDPNAKKQIKSLEEKNAKIRSPSLAGVGAATELNGCVSVRPVAQNCRCHSGFPLARS